MSDINIVISNTTQVNIDDAYYEFLTSQFISSESIPRSESGMLYGDLNKSNEFKYKVVPIKNGDPIEYDDLIFELIPPKLPTPPIITMQPSSFFRRNTVDDYMPGLEVLISDDNIIYILKGMVITLNIDVNSDSYNTLLLQWKTIDGQLLTTGSSLIIDSSNMDNPNQSYYCEVSDINGSVSSDIIIIDIIDPNTNQFINKNIVKNGYGELGTAEWDSIGDIPETVGTMTINRNLENRYTYHPQRYSNP